jgi:hypothetical protein
MLGTRAGRDAKSGVDALTTISIMEGGGSMWACLFSLVIDLCCNMSKAFGRGEIRYSHKGIV